MIPDGSMRPDTVNEDAESGAAVQTEAQSASRLSGECGRSRAFALLRRFALRIIIHVS